MNQTIPQALSEMRIQAAAELNIRSEIEELALEYGRLCTEDEENNAELLCRLVQQQQELTRRYHSTVLWLDRMRRALCALTEDEQRLLTMVYCDGKSPLDTMEALTMEKSSYYRLRKKALENFSKAFYGTDES